MNEKNKSSITIQKNSIQESNFSGMEINTLLEHYQNGHYDLAESLANKLTQLDPNHLLCWKVLGAIFKQTGRLHESLLAIQRIVAISPNDAEAYSNLGVMLKALGRLEEAETSYKKAISLKPDYAEAYSNLGNILKEFGRFEEAETDYKKAISLKPDYPEAYSNLGNTLKELGRLEEAEKSYKKAIGLKPDYAEAYSNLGIMLKELGRLEEAETSYKNAIALQPGFAEAHNSLGNTLKELGKLEEAELSYKKAITLKPNFAEVHSNLGQTLKELGRLEDAELSFKNAVVLKPDFAEAHSNLGILLAELNKLEDAEISYKIAISLKPDFAEAHSNLGNILKDLGRLEEAETSYKNAIVFKPDLAEAHNNLCITYLESNKISLAFDAVISLIKMNQSFETKILFTEVIKKISLQTWDASLSESMVSALTEPWVRPSDVISFACRLLKTDKEFIQHLEPLREYRSHSVFDEGFIRSISKKEFNSSSLLFAMLSSCPIPDAELELFFTNLRRHLLKKVSSTMLTVDEADEEAGFYCSLAQQCFINEYIYFQTPEEIDCFEQLCNRLTRSLETAQDVPALWVISVACYFPLYLVAGADKLLLQNWSEDVKSLLKQQIQEPLEELNLRSSIPVLTSVENQVSLAVQSQYEENPYPRWVSLPKDLNKKYLNSYIQSKFPLTPFKRLVDNENLEILVAGCGTGQHPISTEQSLKRARILAVDLSMTSLAYAKRKTLELGIESIEYAQADLLKLKSLGITFDVIESVGVLHHLANPFEGWEILLSLLKPYGLMRLGFYSVHARRDIVRVRNLIAKEGIGSSSQDIRDYRKYLVGLKNTVDYGFATKSADFFTTSACRDLLFHVSEHHMTLGMIANFLKDHDLNFIGFEIDRSVIRAYKNRFPNDPSACNLKQWDIYEEKNPDTFANMYQFWVQRKV